MGHVSPHAPLFNCNYYSVRLSFRIEPAIPSGIGRGTNEGDSGSGRDTASRADENTGVGDIRMSACSVVAIGGEEGRDGESGGGVADGVSGHREALVFSVPAAAFLRCRGGSESDGGGGRGWAFARHKEPFEGCVNFLKASLTSADRQVCFPALLP